MNLVHQWWRAPRPLDVSSLTAEERDAVYGHFAAASARLEGAELLRGAGKDLAALLLYREGLVPLSKVLLIASKNHVDSAESDAATDQIEKALGSEHAELVAALRDHLEDLDGSRLDALSAPALRDRVDALAHLTDRLRDIATPMSRDRSRIVQYAPVASLVATVLLALGLVGYYALQPTNLAKGKPTIASSTDYNTKPEGAVDGKNYGNFGFHSAAEASPWLRVDLGRRYRLSEVRVFGRHDCCYDQSVPLVLESSDDGQNFREVGTRLEPFEQIEPWVLRFTNLSTRYLRLRSSNETVLVLSEIEAFGEAE